MVVALHSVLKPGHEQAYVHDHLQIPADLAASFERVGIHNWRIWRSGRDLFHLVDCDDYLAAADALDSDPANHAWQALIGEHVEGFVVEGDGHAGELLAQVWTLADQTAAEPS